MIDMKAQIKIYKREDTEYVRKDSLWKPTPEQLEAMECAIIDFEEDGCNTIAGYLKEIYNQIKKL